MLPQTLEPTRTEHDFHGPDALILELGIPFQESSRPEHIAVLAEDVLATADGVVADADFGALGEVDAVDGLAADGRALGFEAEEGWEHPKGFPDAGFEVGELDDFDVLDDAVFRGFDGVHLGAEFGVGRWTAGQEEKQGSQDSRG